MIQFKCRSCHQPVEVPDTRAGRMEECPTCKTIIEVPKPLAQSPSSHGPQAKHYEQGNSIEGVLGFLGILTASLGGAGVVLGVLGFLVGSSVLALSAISNGITSCLAGLVLYGFATAIGELRKIRMLLQTGHNRP